MFRANPARNGYYPTRGVHAPNGLKWKFKTDGWVVSSPAVVTGSANVVCFGSWDGKLYAVDRETGLERWSFKTDGGVLSSPAVDSVVVFFGSYDHHLYAAHLDTGREIWRFKAINSISSSPLITRQFAPAGSLASYPVVRSLYVSFGSVDGNLYVLDMSGGRKLKFDIGHPVVSSPAGPVSESPGSLLPESTDPAIVSAGSLDGNLYAVDIKTGEERWRFKTGGPVDSSPAVAYGAFYFGSADNYVYSVDAGTGLERWRFKTQGPVRSSPAIFDGTIFVGGSDGNLYALDVRRGREKWRFQAGGAVDSSPAVADRVVYFGSNDGCLYALDIDTREVKWKFPTGGEIRSSPVVGDGVVYFGSNDGHLYAVA